MLSDFYGDVLFIVLKMRLESILYGWSVNSIENVSIFGWVVYMYDVWLDEFVFHLLEELECNLAVLWMIICKHGLLEPGGHESIMKIDESEWICKDRWWR